MKTLTTWISNRVLLFLQMLVFLTTSITILISCSQSGSKCVDFSKAVSSSAHQVSLMLESIKHIEEANQDTTRNPQRRILVSPRSVNIDGTLHMVPSQDWCSGFFPGVLWFMYEFTGNAQWKTSAEKFTLQLEQEKYNGRTHDMGFKMMCSFGNGYRLTGNPAYREILLQSARTLITRFNPTAGCIRSWDHNTDKWQFPVIIDNMMNLELLFWATKTSGDPVFADIAIKHAYTTMANHFRDDYSSYHVVDFDTLTGTVLHKHTHQGLSHESAWSRGQAWGLYGYTMTYRESGKPEFLILAGKIAEFILNHPNLPDDLIPLWDFDVPVPETAPRDASAAAIIASALFELGNYLPEKKEHYQEVANQILFNLTENYRAAPDEYHGFLLKHSTGSKPHNSEVDVPMIYADYYYLEALNRKNQNSNNSIIY